MLRRKTRPRSTAGWLAIAAFIGGVVAAAPPASAQPANFAVVTTTLNMRTGPGTQYAVVLVLPAGATVAVQQCTTTQAWCELNYSGRVGWAAARYLNFQNAVSGDPEPPAASGPGFPQGQITGVTIVTLNMRNGPGTGYAVVQSIPAGTTVPIHRCIEGYVWCEVTYRGYTGWVSARYLRSSLPQYGQQPVTNIGAQLGLALFNFIIGQIGGQIPGTPPPQTPPPQQRLPGPNEVCFYADQNYGGAVTCAVMGQNDQSLGGGWNDVISSVRVGAGAIVEVCEDVNYGGICRVLTGNAASLADMNDRISSFRTTQIGAGQPPPPTTARACFYADYNYQGPGFCLNRGDTITALDPNWNDRISSIQVGGGLIVQVCRDQNFAGWCEEYNGNVPQLLGNRNDAISSIRIF